MFLIEFEPDVTDPNRFFIFEILSCDFNIFKIWHPVVNNFLLFGIDDIFGGDLIHTLILRLRDMALGLLPFALYGNASCV